MWNSCSQAVLDSFCPRTFAPPPRRYGGISVGGVNSQVILTEGEIEAVMGDLRNLLGPFLVRMNWFWLP